MTWDDWIKKNEDALKDGFELQFSQQVLRYVRGIKPEDVIPQAAWKDSKGVNRRFDFRIVVPARGIDIAIELDGASKDSDSKRWCGFLDRQNDAVLEARILLRFSNRKLFKEPKKVVEAIESVIRAQAQYFDEKGRLRLSLQTSEAKIASLQSEISTSTNTAVLSLETQLSTTQDELKVAKQNLELLAGKLRDKIETIADPLEDAMKPIVYILGAIAFFAVAVIAFIALDSRSGGDISRRAETTNQRPIDQQDDPVVETAPQQTSRVDSQGALKPQRSNNYSNQRNTSVGENIAAINAPLNVGRDVVACGCAVEVKSQSTRTVINLDRPFPNQPLYLNIWTRNLSSLQEKFGDLTALTGSNVCGVGTVKLYKNMANIEIRSAANLRVLNTPCRSQ